MLHVEHHAIAPVVVIDRAADLPTLFGAEAHVAHAVADAIEAADQHAPILADASAVIGVDAVQIIIAPGVFHPAAGVFGALARDEVDDTARRIGREDRRRSATHRFHAGDRFVEAERLVRIEIAEPAVILHRKAVFLQRDRRIAVGRDAARTHVVRSLAARCLDPETGHLLERLGRGYGVGEAQGRIVQRGDGEAGFRLAQFRSAGAAGDDDVVEIAAARAVARQLLIGGGRLRLRRLGGGRCDRGNRQHHRRSGKQKASHHSFPRYGSSWRGTPHADARRRPHAVRRRMRGVARRAVSSFCYGRCPLCLLDGRGAARRHPDSRFFFAALSAPGGSPARRRGWRCRTRHARRAGRIRDRRS